MSKIYVRRSRPLSKMAAMDSDWLRHFRLLLKNHCMDDHQTFHKCLSSGPEEVLLLFVAIGNPRWPHGLWLAETFSTSSQNHCMDDHQTFHKCLSSGPEEVLLLFVAIGNPRWPPWTLIGWDIFDFFSRTIAWTITKLSTNVCLVVLKKCCYFSLRSEIQDGRLGLWLAETFSTSSQEPLHGRSLKLAINVPQMILLVLKKCCYFSLQSEIQDGCHGLWLAETFSASSQEPLNGQLLNLPQMFLLWSWGSIVPFHLNRKSNMATMDSDWLRHLQLLFKKILHGLSLKLPQLLLSSFSIHLSYIKMKCYKFRKKRWQATIILTKKSRLGKLWGHIHQRPKKIATLADIYQLSDTGPIGPRWLHDVSI